MPSNHVMKKSSMTVSISTFLSPRYTNPTRTVCADWMLILKLMVIRHCTSLLMGNNGQWIEVQIRSERMNDVAEQGFAAHWKYKEGGGSEDEGELEKWLRTIKGRY